jgi:transcriptional regulator with XRE-family HTH domain
MAKQRFRKPKGDTMSGIIADRVRALGLTAYAVGKRAGVSPVVVQRFLKGERDLQLKTVEKLCQALDLVLIVKVGSTLHIELMRERHKEV